MALRERRQPRCFGSLHGRSARQGQIPRFLPSLPTGEGSAACSSLPTARRPANCDLGECVHDATATKPATEVSRAQCERVHQAYARGSDPRPVTEHPGPVKAEASSLERRRTAIRGEPRSDSGTALSLIGSRQPPSLTLEDDGRVECCRYLRSSSQSTRAPLPATLSPPARRRAPSDWALRRQSSGSGGLTGRYQANHALTNKKQKTPAGRPLSVTSGAFDMLDKGVNVAVSRRPRSAQLRFPEGPRGVTGRGRVQFTMVLLSRFPAAVGGDFGARRNHFKLPSAAHPRFPQTDRCRQLEGTFGRRSFISSRQQPLSAERHPYLEPTNQASQRHSRSAHPSMRPAQPFPAASSLLVSESDAFRCDT